MDYRWRRARAHLEMESDGSIKIEPVLERVGDWCRFLLRLCSDELDFDETL